MLDLVSLIQQNYDHFQNLVSNSFIQDYGSLGLFFNSILSATALPIPTEPLTASLLAGGESKWIVSAVLIVGSVIGGTLNYWIGRGAGKLGMMFEKYFKKSNNESKKHQSKVDKILQRLGWFGIFFSPFILVVGDLILITCGTKRYDFRKYMLVMISGKIVKTVVVVVGLGLLFH